MIVTHPAVTNFMLKLLLSTVGIKQEVCM